MTLAENISKFSRIVAAHPDKLTPEAINETVRAIIIADTAHRLDEVRGSYEHVGLQELAKSCIKEFSGVCLGQKSWSMDMSAVMQMRVMCDVLTLLLCVDDVDFAMRYSADVAKAMGQRMRTKRVDYLPFDICERILDYYLEGIDETDEALNEVFEKTSAVLHRIRRLKPNIDKKNLFLSDTLTSPIYLPKKFDSYGFEVQEREPVVLKDFGVERSKLVEMYNMSYIMDVLIKSVARTGRGSSSCALFLSRISQMCQESKDCVPIGVDVEYGFRPGVWRPEYFITNDAVNVLYERCFTTKKVLSWESVENTLLMLERRYKVAGGA